MKWTFLFAAALGCTLALSASAQAGTINFVCRHLGLGWSNGYHASCDCGPGCGQIKGGKDMKIEVLSPGMCFGSGARVSPKYAPAPVER